MNIGRYVFRVVDRAGIAEKLREIGGFLRLKGENPFKARAYETAADAVENVPEDIAALIAEQRLTEVPGIGASLASVIAALYATGTAPLLDRLRQEMPPGILELTRLPAMSLARVRTIHEMLGVAGIDDLRGALEAGQLRTIKGIGPHTEARIREGLARHETQPARILLVDAREVGEIIIGHARKGETVERAELAGAMRRWKETVGTITVVLAARRPAAAVKHFLTLPSIARVETREPEQCTVRLASGLRVRCQAVTPGRFATALLLATGSTAHVASLRERSDARNVDLNALTAPDEGAVYQRLGLPFIPAELREDAGELAAAEGGDSFDDLVTTEDIQGMVHCHTVYSDGRNTIEEMARAADALGMKYLTITDHSPTASYAGGVTTDRLRQQWDEIAAVQEKVKVRLLRGTESDILGDGHLDYPDHVLESFDVIIASIHARMKMDAGQMTRRIVTAMRHPLFKIWGHALGRLVLRRDPIACDVEAVLDVIAASRAAIEVNGDPYRLDLEPKWIREARKRNIRFVISTDAHSTQNFRHLSYGVAMARRGGLRRGEVLNTLPAAQFAAAVRPAP